MFRGGSPASGNASITGGTALFSDGSKTAPSVSFASDTPKGLYHRSASVVSFAANGVEIANFSPTGVGAAFITQMGISAGSDLSVSGADTFWVRDGAGIFAQKNGNTAQELRVYAGNGGFISEAKSVSESLTIAAAATTVSATTIPAGAILLGVAVRVTTVIPTAATFTMTTTTGGTTLQTAAVSTAANSTDPGTAAGASYRAAATTVTITPNLTPGAATGVVRLQFYYLQITPPTS